MVSKKEYDRQRYMANRDKVLERARAYRTANPEAVSIYNAQYYAKNHDKEVARRSAKITCCCGKTVSYSSLPRHRLSRFHIDNC